MIWTHIYNLNYLGCIDIINEQFRILRILLLIKYERYEIQFFLLILKLCEIQFESYGLLRLMGILRGDLIILIFEGVQV